LFKTVGCRAPRMINIYDIKYDQIWSNRLVWPNNFVWFTCNLHVCCKCGYINSLPKRTRMLLYDTIKNRQTGLILSFCSHNVVWYSLDRYFLSWYHVSFLASKQEHFFYFLSWCYGSHKKTERRCGSTVSRLVVSSVKCLSLCRKMMYRRKHCLIEKKNSCCMNFYESCQKKNFFDGCIASMIFSNNVTWNCVR